MANESHASEQQLCLCCGCGEVALDNLLCAKHQHVASVLGIVESLSREHIESAQCWCSPTLDFTAEDGRKVWVHHEPN